MGLPELDCSSRCLTAHVMSGHAKLSAFAEGSAPNVAADTEIMSIDTNTSRGINFILCSPFHGESRAQV
jgi:hypothetical protein